MSRSRPFLLCVLAVVVLGGGAYGVLRLSDPTPPLGSDASGLTGTGDPDPAVGEVAPSTPATLRGQLRSPTPRIDPAASTVTLVTPSGATRKASVNEVGRLDLNELAAGRHLLVVRNPLAKHLQRDVTLRPGERADLGDIELVPEPDALILGTWMHAVGRARANPITLLPDGTIRCDGKGCTWALKGHVLTMRWPRRDAPGGHWEDRCVVAEDWRSYAGVNQSRMAINGTFEGE